MADMQNTTDLNTLIKQQSQVQSEEVPSLNIETNEETVLKEAGIEVFDQSPQMKSASQTVYAKEEKTTSMLKNENSPIKDIPIQVSSNSSKIASAQDLENQFKNTLQKKNSYADLSSSGIESEKAELLSLLEKVREHLNEKKIHVKERLDVLKREKEEIATSIDEIKELEETEQKIKDKVDKLTLLEQEIDSLQDEATKELRS